MIPIQGKHNIAHVYSSSVEDAAFKQILELCNQPFVEGSKIRMMPDCLGEQTEVLTKSGFRKIVDVTLDDEVANVDSDGKVFFAHPKDVIVRELRQDEVVYSLDVPTFNAEIIVTENHRNVLRSGIVMSKDLPDTFRVKDMVWNGAGLLHAESHGLKHEELLMLAWIVGDGNIQVTHNQRSDNRRIRFGFRKKRKIRRVLELCQSLGIDPHMSVTDKQTTIYFNTEDSAKFIQLLGHNKQYPMSLVTSLTRDEAIAFLNEAIQIDGDYESFANGRGMRFNSTRMCDVDFLSALVAINYGACGMRTRVIDTAFVTGASMHYVGVVKESTLLSGKSGLHNRPITKKRINYHGKVVCLTCDSGMFIARADGRTFVTGNCHAGAGCTIGTTMTITDKIVPNLVGVDIGCGVHVAMLDTKELLPAVLDAVIHQHIPAGCSTRSEPHQFIDMVPLKDLIWQDFDHNRARNSIGTLGGGNHFIEANKDDEGNIYLVVHSGSRNLGKQVAEHYQRVAVHSLRDQRQVRTDLVNRLRSEGREREIESEVAKLHFPRIPEDLSYVSGAAFDDYLHDIDIVQKYADLNRRAMVYEIARRMGVKVCTEFVTIHNYIDVKNMILRKGAISAQAGERVIIPINMRDGSLICEGLGNPDWNYSAPHGAGRLMSRSQAKRELDIDEFKDTMKGVYSTTVGRSTLDEAPMAYKPMSEILEHIGDTVKVLKTIKPFFNFKAAE